LEKMFGIHATAILPQYVTKRNTFLELARRKKETTRPNYDAPAFRKSKVTRRVVLYANCLVNFNKPGIGLASLAVLSHIGVDVKVVSFGCCGMPQLEQGIVGACAMKATKIARELGEYIRQGASIVSIVPSCTLMMKHEWKTLLPDNEDVAILSANTFDISEYIVGVAKKEGLAPGLKPIPGTVYLHSACHSRVQNMGFKAKEMLELIPNLKLSIIERCSGHGGSFGVMKETHPTALKVGKSVFSRIVRESTANENKNEEIYVSSECPLAGDHILQGVEGLDEDVARELGKAVHPIELLAKAYKLTQ